VDTLRGPESCHISSDDRVSRILHSARKTVCDLRPRVDLYEVCKSNPMWLSRASHHWVFEVRCSTEYVLQRYMSNKDIFEIDMLYLQSTEYLE
jgi:hypothetical protein